MTEHQHERHMSSFHVELGRAHHLAEAERTWVEAHLATCMTCTALAASVADAHQEFRAFAARSTSALHDRQLRHRRRQVFRWLTAGLLAPSFAALLAVAAVNHVRSAAERDVGDGIGIKGGPALGVAARRGQRIFRVGPAEPVRAGDELRFMLDNVSHPFVLIASIDGGGHANVYAPYEGKTSLAIQPGEHVEVPGSIILDDSPGPERVFALFSRSALDADVVRAALRAVAERGRDALRTTTRIDVPDTEQSTLLIEKVAP